MDITGNLNDYKFWLKTLRAEKMDFTTVSGSFSAKITTKKGTKFFTDTKRSNAIFSAVNSLKKDLKPYLEFFQGQRHDLNYYFYKSGFEEKRGDFYNIDIKQAYPTCLKNTGFLSNETINKIDNLKKPDKVAVIGMLAHEPDIFTFQKGILTEYSKRKNEFSPCFFWCVEKIQDLMKEIICNVPNDYFFTWVDGVFFEPCETAKKKICDIVECKNFRQNFEVCKNLDFKRTEHNIKFTYYKETEKKILTFPNRVTENKKKYEIFKQFQKEDEEENFRKFLELDFVLDEKGNVIF